MQHGTSNLCLLRFARDLRTSLTQQWIDERTDTAYFYDYSQTAAYQGTNWGRASDDVHGFALDDRTHTNGAFANESFGYDAVGNRNTTGYTTQAGNRLTADGTYTYAYDDEGNLSVKTEVATGDQTVYTWDHRNRLTGVDLVVGATTTAVARYTYDALDRRIKAVSGGATRWTAYDGISAILDFDGSGATTARYLQGEAVDEILARETAGGAVAWYLPDRLGTIRDLADHAGAIIDHVDYSAYGQILAETAPAVGDRWKFTGREWDAAAGRWLSQDPIGFAGGDANLYRYVSNAPSESIDPLGLRLQGRPSLPSYGPGRSRIKGDEDYKDDTECALTFNGYEAITGNLEDIPTVDETFIALMKNPEFRKTLLDDWRYTRKNSGHYERGGWILWNPQKNDIIITRDGVTHRDPRTTHHKWPKRLDDNKTPACNSGYHPIYAYHMHPDHDRVSKGDPDILKNQLNNIYGIVITPNGTIFYYTSNGKPVRVGNMSTYADH